MSASQGAGGGRGAKGRWQLAAAVIALIAGPAVLYKVLPLTGVPVALVSGAVAGRLNAIQNRRCRCSRRPCARG